MFCEAYRQSLTDAAAGGELTIAMKQHIGACASCRAAFAEEQALYAAIDSGVCVVANGEVPASLIPRVHVALNNEPVPSRPKRSWLFAAVPILAASAIVFVYQPWSTSHDPVQPVRNGLNGITSTTPAMPATVNNAPARGVNRLQHGNAVASAQNHLRDAKAMEVIVDPEEGAAFLRYEARLREQARAKSRTLLAKKVELPQGIEPLEIAELEVRDLAIAVLAKPEADADR